MRVRHRHLNPRDCGAQLVLDARRINQSVGSAVSTWTDTSRSGFNAVQATSGNQPTFQKDNGTESVRFVTDDFLSCGDVLDLGTNDLMMIVVAKINNTAEFGVAGKTSARVLTGRYAILKEAGNITAYYAAAAANIPSSSSDSNTAKRMLTMQIIRAGNVYMHQNGIVKSGPSGITGADTESHNTGDVFIVGAYGNAVGTTATPLLYHLDGDVSLVTVIFSKSESLRRKVEHSSALSFKVTYK